MTKEELENLKKTKDVGEFIDFLNKYGYKYNNIGYDKWEPEIKEHYIKNILETTEEAIEEMQNIIREYKDDEID